MHENAKIAEAEFFLNRMLEAENDSQEFHFFLSAFLSAARSVLQYALEEVRGTPQAQQWYDSKISGTPILQFFKGKRDLNIHQEPVGTNRHLAIEEQVPIHISESVRVVITRENGTTEIRESSSVPAPARKGESKSSISSKYYFNDWPGTEDAIKLCQSYIVELRTLVEDGTTRRYIRG